MAEDRFLSRWSRRKAKARGGRGALEAERPEPVFPPTVVEPADHPVAAVAPEVPPEEVVEADIPEREPTEEELDAEAEELGLPPLESLGEGSDFKAFMGKEVPARLRNRALRKLWISNPVLANLDGLVDYGEDFTDAATVVENMATAYRVGQGYKRPEEEEQEVEEVTDDLEEVAEEADAAEPVEAAAKADSEDDADEEPSVDAVGEAAGEADETSVGSNAAARV